jgi:hypothetical protein
LSSSTTDFSSSFPNEILSPFISFLENIPHVPEVPIAAAKDFFLYISMSLIWGPNDTQLSFMDLPEKYPNIP